jgi:hypothetical protein
MKNINIVKIFAGGDQSYAVSDHGEMFVWGD